MKAEMRRPTVGERQILEALLRVDFPGRDKLKELIDGSLVSTIDAYGGIMMHPSSSSKAETIKQIPVEGTAKDIDGMTVNFLLRVRDGQPAELEIYKDDGSEIKTPLENLLISAYSLPPHPSQ